MKKLISTIMCLALLVGCLAGCGGNTQTGSIDGKGLKILLSLSQADTFRIGNIGDVYPEDFKHLIEAVQSTKY